MAEKPPDDGPEVTGFFSALSAGFGLKSRDRKLLLQVAWVFGVSSSLGYIFGMFAAFGITAPYARASDLQQLQETLAVSTRITLSQELRAQARAQCLVTDTNAYESIQRYIDTLQYQYSKLNNGQPYRISNICIPKL